jgi:hypothetical protein
MVAAEVLRHDTVYLELWTTVVLIFKVHEPDVCKSIEIFEDHCYCAPAG